MLYIGTKVVHAKPMNRAEYNKLRGWSLPSDENPEDPGYLVEYTEGGSANHPDYKGYVSWSPKDVFEKSYFPFDEQFSFGDAILAIQAGQKVARQEWNGKGMYIEYVPPIKALALKPYIMMRTADDAYVPWVASQTDILARDWVIVVMQ